MSSMRWLFVAVLGCFLASPIAAIPVGYEVVFAAEDELGQSLGSQDLSGLLGMGIIDESSNPEAGTETIQLNQAMTAGTGWIVNSFSSTLKEDPFITNNFNVTNNTGGVATFTFTVSAPIPAFGATQIVQSNILIQLNDDDNANNATLTSAAPDPIYEAFVNGGSVLTLLPDPYMLFCTSPSNCSPPGTADGQGGDEVISQAFGPVVANSIGITVTFTLSDGDSAAVLSRFEIVPEPGTALLLGLGLIGIAGVRRRV